MTTQQFKDRKNRERKATMRRLKKSRMVPCVEPVDAWTEGARSRLLTKVNLAEEHVDRLLADCSCKYRRERPIEIGGKKYFIDFLVTSLYPGRRKVRVAIEVDGGYHDGAVQQLRDRAKDADLLATSRVWSILRITADDALAMDAAALRCQLETAPIGAMRCVRTA